MKFLLYVIMGCMLLTLSASAQLAQVTNLPTFYITTTNAAPVVSEEDYIPGHLTVAGGTTAEGFYDGDLEIRGRGNSTWGFPKKPYRLKLASKYKMLGMPAKEKTWVLLANYGDKSLIRNALAFEASRFMGFAFTPSYRFVDVYLNGDFQGNYMVTDQMEVQPDRVAVDAQDPEDVAEPAITGGYMLEVDGYAQSEPVWFSTPRGITVTVKYPDDDDINTAQKDYIKDHYALFENTLFGSNFKDSMTGYRKYLDVKSAVDYLLLSDLTANSDCFWSTYMYKLRGDSKLYYGPVWDFDLGFNADNRLGDETYKSMFDFGHFYRDWYTRLKTDEYFYHRLEHRWNELRDDGLLARLQHVTDSLQALLQQSQALNFQRWPVLNSIVHLELVALGSFDAEVAFVKDFTTTHFNWIDAEFKGLDTSRIYNITSVNSGLVLDLRDKLTAGGTPLIQFRDDSTATQRWKLENLDNGYYRVRSVPADLLLDNSASVANGTQLSVNVAASVPENQMWRILNVGGKYAILNRKNGKAVDVDGWSVDPGAVVQQWDANVYDQANQQWLFTEAYSASVTPPDTTVVNPPDTTVIPPVIETITRIYPNPVQRGFQIKAEFELKQASPVLVVIFNAQGALVAKIDKGTLPAGRNVMDVRLPELSKGIYLVRIIAGKQELTRKLSVE